MNVRKIKMLVSKSYSGSELNPRKVTGIAQHLARTDLKKYIQELKNSEGKRAVRVILPFKNQLTTSPLERLFPNRRIIYETDPALIAGIKIIDNDMVYEFDLKAALERLVSHLEENYD